MFRRPPPSPFRLVVVAGLATLGAVGPPALSADAGRPAAETVTRTGVRAGDICGPLRELRRPRGHLTCTHGDDPRPNPLADPTVGPDDTNHSHDRVLEHIPPARASAPGLACAGDGGDGNRVQAVYAFPADRPDRYTTAVDSIRAWAAELDAVARLLHALPGPTAATGTIADYDA